MSRQGDKKKAATANKNGGKRLDATAERNMDPPDIKRRTVSSIIAANKENNNQPRSKRSNAGKGTLDRMERESAAIQQTNKRKKASTIPDEEEENEAAPPKKLKRQTKTQAVSQVSQVQKESPIRPRAVPSKAKVTQNTQADSPESPLRSGPPKPTKQNAPPAKDPIARSVSPTDLGPRPRRIFRRVYDTDEDQDKDVDHQFPADKGYPEKKEEYEDWSGEDVPQDQDWGGEDNWGIVIANDAQDQGQDCGSQDNGQDWGDDSQDQDQGQNVAPSKMIESDVMTPTNVRSLLNKMSGVTIQTPTNVRSLLNNVSAVKIQTLTIGWGLLNNVSAVKIQTLTIGWGLLNNVSAVKIQTLTIGRSLLNNVSAVKIQTLTIGRSLLNNVSAVKIQTLTIGRSLLNNVSAVKIQTLTIGRSLLNNVSAVKIQTLTNGRSLVRAAKASGKSSRDVSEQKGAYNILQKHRQTNHATRPPTVQHLNQCRKKQQSEPEDVGDGRDGTDGDGEGGNDSDDSDGNNTDNNNSDGNNSDNSDNGNNMALTKKKRSPKDAPAPPTQERFYPRGGWRKVFNRCKDLVFVYLLLSDLFPLQEKFLLQIDTFLLESVAYVEHELMLQLPITYWDYRSYMVTLATDLPDRGLGQAEYEAMTIKNVEALLHRSDFHRNGKDAEVAVSKLVIRPSAKQYSKWESVPWDRSSRVQDLQAALYRRNDSIEEYSTGHQINARFSEARYITFYDKGAMLMEELENDNDHWTKCTEEWGKWARLAALKRKQTKPREVADDDDMDIDLD
ncbi:hypothetical protein B0H13DRAFT_1928884 [Mycena leptocephala]|nr:hypothetical protein B0H13DRAFT_1928884 [Mycena leptocephala]